VVCSNSNDRGLGESSERLVLTADPDAVVVELVASLLSCSTGSMWMGKNIWKDDMNCSEEDKKQGRTNRDVEDVNCRRELGRKSLKEDVNCRREAGRKYLEGEDVRTRNSELHVKVVLSKTVVNKYFGSVTLNETSVQVSASLILPLKESVSHTFN
jgi:hypothetical protein